jgi:hypothetical protein
MTAVGVPPRHPTTEYEKSVNQVFDQRRDRCRLPMAWSLKNSPPAIQEPRVAARAVGLPPFTNIVASPPNQYKNRDPAQPQASTKASKARNPQNPPESRPHKHRSTSDSRLDSNYETAQSSGTDAAFCSHRQRHSSRHWLCRSRGFFGRLFQIHR